MKRLKPRLPHKLYTLLTLGIVLMSPSCAPLHKGVDGTVEVAKTLWGSSTRALEEARYNAITRIYNKPYWDCVRSAIAYSKKHWVIFKKDEINGYMVVMGVPGCVNTTEIGVFFDELSEGQTRIEISSLSTNAKRKVSLALFHGLDIAFGYVPPDAPFIIAAPKTTPVVTPTTP